MNFIFKLVIYVAAISAIHCINERTVGELRTTLAPLKQKVDIALAGYKKHNYKVFQQVIQKFSLAAVVQTTSDETKLNINESYSSVSAWAFRDLTVLQFVYPVFADPVKLSDALKVSALATLLQEKREEDFFFWERHRKVNFSDPDIAGLIDSILEIGEEEKKANFDFNQTNLPLDELYYDLHDVKEELFPLTSGLFDYTTEGLRQFCTSNKDVSTTLIKNVEEMKTNLAKMPKLLPLDSREKVENMAEVLEEYIRMERLLRERLEQEKIKCVAGHCVFTEVKQPDPDPYVENKTTLPELLKSFNFLRPLLDHAISGYELNKYTVFAKVASQFVFSHSLITRIQKLPSNSTFDDSQEAKRTYLELTTYKFLYPILIDPKKLGDALKVNAISSKLNALVLDRSKSSDLYFIKNAALKEIRATIQKIIKEEAGNDFNKPNVELDDLYADLGPQNPETLGLTYGYIEQECLLMEHFCQGPKSFECNKLNGSFGLNLSNLQQNNKYLKEEYPIDDERKIGTIIELVWQMLHQRHDLAQFRNSPYLKDGKLVYADCDVLRCLTKKRDDL